MNTDDGEIRQIEDIPAEEIETRWTELKDEELKVLRDLEQSLRPERLAAMRSGVDSSLPDAELESRVAAMRGANPRTIAQVKSKSKRRAASKIASRSRARNRK